MEMLLILVQLSRGEESKKIYNLRINANNVNNTNSSNPQGLTTIPKRWHSCGIYENDGDAYAAPTNKYAS